jgi:hypothetical protein
VGNAQHILAKACDLHRYARVQKPFLHGNYSQYGLGIRLAIAAA